MPVFGWNYDSILELSAGMHTFSLTFIGSLETELCWSWTGFLLAGVANKYIS